MVVSRLAGPRMQQARLIACQKRAILLQNWAVQTRRRSRARADSGGIPAKNCNLIDVLILVGCYGDARAACNATAPRCPQARSCGQSSYSNAALCYLRYNGTHYFPPGHQEVHDATCGSAPSVMTHQQTLHVSALQADERRLAARLQARAHWLVSNNISIVASRPSALSARDCMYFTQEPV